MTDDQTSHITVTDKRASFESSRTYAISTHDLQRLQSWVGTNTVPTGADTEWFIKNELRCQMDNPDGPAETYHSNSYSCESYYSSGFLHREGGPAVIKRFADGSGEHCYYRRGKLYNENGSAVVKICVDGSEVDPVSTVPGVTVKCPAPKASSTPPGPALISESEKDILGVWQPWEGPWESPQRPRTESAKHIARPATWI